MSSPFHLKYNNFNTIVIKYYDEETYENFIKITKIVTPEMNRGGVNKDGVGNVLYIAELTVK